LSRPEQVELVEALRRQRWTGLRIAQQAGLSRATVSRILRRLKLSRLRDLEPRQPVQRYEHLRAGDMLHLDIKKLGRIAKPGHRVTGIHVSHLSTEKHEIPVRALESAFLI